MLLAPPLPALSAQGFAVKPSLAAGGVTGCVTAGMTPAPVATGGTNASGPGTVAELLAEAQQAALQGEHAQAREAYARAAVLDPGNARISYLLARELEALGEASAAVREYCRYLSLRPRAEDADEVRGRIVRLTPASELARLEEARANFQSGVALLQRKQYAAADSVFASVSRQVPTAAEPPFNRALSLAARGERLPAMQEFERYLDLAPQAPDRVQVRSAMARIPDRVYSPGSALASGLAIPGLGQMSTGRAIWGVITLGTAGGGLVLAMRRRETVSAASFTDPFGNTYTDSIPRTTRPLWVAGVATAGVVWLGSALESMFYARRTRRQAEEIIVTAASRRLGVDVRDLPGSRVGLAFSVH